MIHKIYSNDSSFKQVEFKNGLNVILADREKDSGVKDTRNGVGKTTLIEVMHFCLGSKFDSKSKLKNIEEIRDWNFSIELDICGKTIVASRSIENGKIIKIEGEIDDLPITFEFDDDDLPFLTNNDWGKLLGKCLFGISEKTRKYSPTFRSLISYFIRRSNNAYTDPFKHYRNQNPWDWQVNNAFLLGLNWEHASNAQDIKDEEKLIKARNTLLKDGSYLSLGKLEPEKLRLIEIIDFEEKSLSEFKVHEKYEEIQERANTLTNIIHELSNNNLVNKQRLQRYNESISSENPPENILVEELYNEVELYFPDAIKKRLDEARIFHETIIRNRKEFLLAEISILNHQINNIKKEIKNKQNERSNIMCILNTHGALEEFNVLQNMLLEKKQKLSEINNQISKINEIDTKKQIIKEDKIELNAKIKRDYEDSRPNWEKAVKIFNENSFALYNTPGDLIIDVSDKGYAFNVEIKKSDSEGISKMKIFCYDLMLVDINAKKQKIDFLVHDSTIFDSVDSRQRALALQYAHEKAVKDNFQYICNFNSDMIPFDDFKGDFDLDEFIRLRLTDKDPSGSLFGFEF